MQIRLAVEILPGESVMIFKQLSIAVRIFIRQVGTECMEILPAPHDGVSGIEDHSRRIEMIGMDIVNLDRASGTVGFPITATGISSNQMFPMLYRST